MIWYLTGKEKKKTKEIFKEIILILLLKGFLHLYIINEN